jgi:hypothetical protein
MSHSRGVRIGVNHLARATQLDTTRERPTTAPAASAPSSEAAASERAKRETDKVFQWIRIHSDKPRKTATSKDEKTSATAPATPVKVAAKPLPKAGEPARNGTAQEDVASSSVTGAPAWRDTAAAPVQLNVAIPSAAGRTTSPR